MQDTMTPKERWSAVINREKPDRVPMDYWGTPEITEKVMAYLGVDDYWAMVERLHIDAVVTVSPAYVGPKIKDGHDFYGCGYRCVDYGTGAYDEVISHPLADFKTIEDVETNYQWPTADWFDFTVLPDQLRGRETYPVRGGGSEPFYHYTLMRGLKQAIIDMAANPDFLHYCLGKLFDFSYEFTRRIFEHVPGRVMISYVAEDFGSQENLLFSPGQIREFFLPGMKRMFDLVHQAGAYAFTHSDGAIRKIISRPDRDRCGYPQPHPMAL